MAHFNFVISQNAKWGHAGFYIDRHRMMSSNQKSKYAYRKILFYKKSTGCLHHSQVTDWRDTSKYLMSSVDCLHTHFFVFWYYYVTY